MPLPTLWEPGDQDGHTESAFKAAGTAPESYQHSLEGKERERERGRSWWACPGEENVHMSCTVLGQLIFVCESEGIWNAQAVYGPRNYSTSKANQRLHFFDQHFPVRKGFPPVRTVAATGLQAEVPTVDTPEITTNLKMPRLDAVKALLLQPVCHG